MERKYDVITFDCYGTLIDWESGIRTAFMQAAAEDGISLNPEDVTRVYAAVEPVVERERYRTYADVLTETAARVAHALGWPLAYERATFLIGSVAEWKPFADTNPALERLSRAGYRLGILSNVDDDLLDGTRRHFSVPFDVVVTAQQIRSYKPAPGHFQVARERIGAGARWLHAAQSSFHDIAPAGGLGIDTAWINRKGLTGATATYEYRDLGELAAALT